MPSNWFLDMLLLVLFCFMLLVYMSAVAERLVPSAMEESYPGFTQMAGFVLMLLGTTMLWRMMSWSTPIQKPAPTLLGLPSASASTLVLDDFVKFPKARQLDIIFTAIQEMKVEHKRDTGKMLAALAWMIKIPIFVVIILIAVIAWIIRFLKENSDELINTSISKVTAFLRHSLGPWRSAVYGTGFRFSVGPTERIREVARVAVGGSKHVSVILSINLEACQCYFYSCNHERFSYYTIIII
jgi:hypothetical protein